MNAIAKVNIKQTGIPEKKKNHQDFICPLQTNFKINKN